MKRIAARVTGRVQGVFFRDSTVRVATQLGVTGWVRNERDGSVSVEAQGAAEQIDDLVAWLRTGPRQATVVNVRLTELEPEPRESEFAIV